MQRREMVTAILHVVCSPLQKSMLHVMSVSVGRIWFKSSNSHHATSDADDVFSRDRVIFMLIKKSEYLAGNEISHNNLNM